MSLVSKPSTLALAKPLNSFKKLYQLCFNGSSDCSTKSLLCITTKPSSSLMLILTFPSAFPPSLKSKSKNLASVGSVVACPPESPSVTCGNCPLILLKRFFAITFKFIQCIYLLVAYKYRHWHYLICCVFVCLTE